MRRAAYLSITRNRTYYLLVQTDSLTSKDAAKMFARVNRWIGCYRGSMDVMVTWFRECIVGESDLAAEDLWELGVVLGLV